MTRRNWLWAGAAAGALLIGAAPALAHTNYMMPSVFSTTQGEVVTIESSFAEMRWFAPEFVVVSADYHVIRPDGARDSFDTMTELEQLTVLESDLTEDGTYRFTTGERLGRGGELALVDGAWVDLDENGEAPAGAMETASSQTATVADVYVTKGAPTRAAVDGLVGRLAIRPITHPSEIYLDEGFSFELMFDGEPFANQELTLVREGGSYEEPKYEIALTTDEQGRASASFDEPGVYLMWTRHRARAPEGAESGVRSYTTSLTFEVLR
jgi:uncharacterized GH25 family protein